LYFCIAATWRIQDEYIIIFKLFEYRQACTVLDAHCTAANVGN